MPGIRVSSRHDSDAVPIKSQHCGYLHKTGMKTSSADMMEETFKRPDPWVKSYRQLMLLRKGETIFFRKKADLNSMWSA